MSEKKKAFVVKRPWFGVEKGEVVELAVGEDDQMLCKALEPNVEEAPEGSKAKEDKELKLPATPKR